MLKDRPVTLSEGQVKDLARRLKACLEQTDRDLASYNDAVDTGRAFFAPRPARTDPPWEGASSITVPACEATLLQQRARIDSSLLCIDPVVRVEGPDRTAAADVEAFLQRFLTQQVGFRERFLAAVDSALQDGSACVYVTWRTERRKQTRWETVEVEVPAGVEYLLAVPETGETVQLTPEEAAQWEAVQPGTVQERPITALQTQRKGTEVEVAAYDAPYMALVETGYVPGTTKARWGTYPAADANVQESTGVFVRYSLTGEELNQRVDEEEFDGDAVARLRRTGGQQENLETAEDVAEGVEAENVADETFQWKPFDVTDLYWRVVPEADPAKGETEQDRNRRERARAQDYLITLHEETDTVLRCRPAPWWHGKRPFALVRPFRKRFGVHGVSTPDLAGAAQETMQQVLRDSFDAAQKRIKPPKKVRRGLLAFREREDLESQDRPGGLFEVDYPESIEVMGEGLGDPGAGLALLEVAERWRQMNTGVNEQSAGMIRGRATATEVEVANAEGGVLFRHILQNVAEDIQETVKLVVALCYQYVDHDTVQETWALSNPENAPREPGMLPGEWELSPERGLTLHAWGTTQTSNEAVKRITWEKALPVVMSFPEVAQPVEVLASLPDEMVEQFARRQYAVHRAFVASRPLGNIEEIVGSEEDFVSFTFALRDLFRQQVAQVQAMAGAGVPGAGEESLEGRQDTGSVGEFAAPPGMAVAS